MERAAAVSVASAAVLSVINQTHCPVCAREQGKLIRHANEQCAGWLQESSSSHLASRFK